MEQPKNAWTIGPVGGNQWSAELVGRAVLVGRAGEHYGVERLDARSFLGGAGALTASRHGFESREAAEQAVRRFEGRDRVEPADEPEPWACHMVTLGTYTVTRVIGGTRQWLGAVREVLNAPFIFNSRKQADDAIVRAVFGSPAETKRAAACPPTGSWRAVCPPTGSRLADVPSREIDGIRQSGAPLCICGGSGLLVAGVCCDVCYGAGIQLPEVGARWSMSGGFGEDKFLDYELVSKTDGGLGGHAWTWRHLLSAGLLRDRPSDFATRVRDGKARKLLYATGQVAPTGETVHLMMPSADDGGASCYIPCGAGGAAVAVLGRVTCVPCLRRAAAAVAKPKPSDEGFVCMCGRPKPFGLAGSAAAIRRGVPYLFGCECGLRISVIAQPKPATPAEYRAALESTAPGRPLAERVEAVKAARR